VFLVERVTLEEVFLHDIDTLTGFPGKSHHSIDE
jgi:hypothetical protein